MQIAWVDALRWAITSPEVLQQFREQTGNNWTPARSPIEAMVDKAVGADKEFIFAFTDWFNVNIWGDV